MLLYMNKYNHLKFEQFVNSSNSKYASFDMNFKLLPDNSLIERFTTTAPPYDNGKRYEVGDVVTKDGQIYRMIDGIGAPGYPPPRPTNWQLIGATSPVSSPLPPSPPSTSSASPYDNNRTYQLGEIVSKDGKTYKMIDGIGAPGYPPPRPTNWREI